MKKLLFLFLLVLLIINCRKQDTNGKIKIISSIFPLYDFVKEVGKDKVDASIILSPGTEAHSFEPTPQDIVKINESSMFIYIGEAMEPWAHDILNSIENKKLVIIEAGENIEMMSEDDHDAHDEHNETEKEHHHHEGKDPHIWLDFEIDQKIVELIADKLCEIDPSNKDFYQQNAKSYNEKLMILDKEYKEVIDRCELKTIMYAGHFAFGYLAKRYGLKHISPYNGFTPDTEPTPQKIVELIDNIKKNKIEYLFYEELLDPKVAKAVSKDTNVKLELLHAAHNLTKDEMEKNVSFIQIMEENLVKIKKGLKYK